MFSLNMMTSNAMLLSLFSAVLGQRYNFDARCPAAVALDPPGQQRDPTSSSSYMFKTLAVYAAGFKPAIPCLRVIRSRFRIHHCKQANATVTDCVHACCHDWSCVSFAFYPSAAAGRPSECTGSSPCCVFKDDLDALVGNAPTGIVTGKRGHLAAKAVQTSVIERATSDACERVRCH